MPPAGRALLAVVATAAVLAGCGGPGAVTVAPPSPDPAARAACARLHAALPGSLEHLDRRDTSPRSTLTAAWGSPAVVLRCGVGPPAGFAAGAQTLLVDGVQWFQHVAGATVTWTTVDRQPRVELRVPTSYDGQAGLLVDVSAAVRSAR